MWLVAEVPHRTCSGMASCSSTIIFSLPDACSAHCHLYQSHVAVAHLLHSSFRVPSLRCIAHFRSPSSASLFSALAAASRSTAPSPLTRGLAAPLKADCLGPGRDRLGWRGLRATFDAFRAPVAARAPMLRSHPRGRVARASMLAELGHMTAEKLTRVDMRRRRDLNPSIALCHYAARPSTSVACRTRQQGRH